MACFPLMTRFQRYNHDYTASSMVQDDSPTDNLDAAGDKGWLRLSIGGADVDSRQPDAVATELDLLPGGRTELQLRNDSLVFPQPPAVNWGFRPSLHNIGITTSFNSSSCSTTTPFQLHAGLEFPAAGWSSDTIRVIDPPRRPQSGIWFTLQPLENQGKQPVLAQRSSSYLRIKDGRMTVRLLMKYLVKKLRLDSESEMQIEIRCRGEKLEPCLTMQHIRDNIWLSSSSSSKQQQQQYSQLTLLPHSSTIQHLMVLHYATSSAN